VLLRRPVTSLPVKILAAEPAFFHFIFLSLFEESGILEIQCLSGHPPAFEAEPAPWQVHSPEDIT